VTIRPEVLASIFTGIHRDIDVFSNAAVSNVNEVDICYPPNVDLSEKEREALSQLELSDAAKSGLQKVIANAISTTFFHFLNVVDGTGDPDCFETIKPTETWGGLVLEERGSLEDQGLRDEEAHYEFLHEYFYDSSWLFKDWTQVD